MKEMDCVEVIVEKKEYAEEGVHKRGCRAGYATDVGLRRHMARELPAMRRKGRYCNAERGEEDMKIVPVMNAILNEQEQRPNLTRRRDGGGFGRI